MGKEARASVTCIPTAAGTSQPSASMSGLARLTTAKTTVSTSPNTSAARYNHGMICRRSSQA